MFGAGVGDVLGQIPTDPTADQRVTLEQLNARLEEAIAQIESRDPQAMQSALQTVRRVKMLHPTLEKIRLAEGLYAAAQSRGAPDAIQKLIAYNRMPDRSPRQDDHRGYAALGRIYRDMLKYRMARPAFEMAKKLAPPPKEGERPLRADFAMDLAEVLLQLGRKEDALEEAKEARRWAMDDPVVHLRFAGVAAATEDLAAMEEAVRRAIVLSNAQLAINPFKRETYGLLRSAYQALMRIEERKVRDDPDDGLHYFSLAVALRRAAAANERLDLLTAHETLKMALEKEPNNAQWLVERARLEAALGANEDALATIERVLQISPNNREAIDIRGSLSGGSGSTGGR